jgi:hypothetical protein
MTASERAPILLGTITVDSLDRFVSHGKVEAGLTVALELTEQYHLVNSQLRDSLIREKAPGRDVSIGEAMRLIVAGGSVFANVQRKAHLIRAEVIIVTGPGVTIESRGVGYGLIRLQREGSETVLADPAILEALQRATALALKDSLVYAKLEAPFNVKPAALLAMGGIAYKNDETLPQWDIYEKKVTTSFDLMQTAVGALARNEQVVVLDAETRDSMFADARLYMVENYNASSRDELTTLAAFEVTRMITGSLTRTAKGATLQLQFGTLDNKGQLRAARTTEQAVPNDSVDDLRTAMVKGLRELLPGTTVERPVEPK